MKKRQIAVLMGLVIMAVPTAAYAEESQTEIVADAVDGEGIPGDLPDDAQEVSQMVMGTVTEIGEDYITVSITTGMGGQDMEKPEDAGEEADGGDVFADGEVGEEGSDAAPDDVETADAETETQTITLTEETQYLKASGGMGGGNNGSDSAGGEAMEKPEWRQ